MRYSDTLQSIRRVGGVMTPPYIALSIFNKESFYV